MLQESFKVEIVVPVLQMRKEGDFAAQDQNLVNGRTGICIKVNSRASYYLAEMSHQNSQGQFHSFPESNLVYNLDVTTILLV